MSSLHYTIVPTSVYTLRLLSWIFVYLYYIDSLYSLRSCDLTLMKELGEGAFGTVFKGIWKNNVVAVKRISKIRFNPKEVRYVSVFDLLVFMILGDYDSM